jgi:hypothetical protein
MRKLPQLLKQIAGWLDERPVRLRMSRVRINRSRLTYRDRILFSVEKGTGASFSTKAFARWVAVSISTWSSVAAIGVRYLSARIELSETSRIPRKTRFRRLRPSPSGGVNGYLSHLFRLRQRSLGIVDVLPSYGPFGFVSSQASTACALCQAERPARCQGFHKARENCFGLQFAARRNTRSELEQRGGK